MPLLFLLLAVELKLPDKLAAIQLDNKLAGDGDPDEANDEIAALILRCAR